MILLTLHCAEAQAAQYNRPILLELCSVNQRFWSGARVILSGIAEVVGSGYSTILPPPIGRMPTLFPILSVK